MLRFTATSLLLAVGLTSWGWAVDGQAPVFDLLVKNAQIVDGSGGPAYAGNVAVKNGRIVALGQVEGAAKEVLDAQGRVVAPGFVDVHTHSEDICKLPLAENFLRMGVTTLVTGNCGMSRTDLGAFFDEVAKAQVSLHVAALIGHGAVREKAMGGRFIRAPDSRQLDTMKKMVDQAMKDGALGMSTGLIYVPGSFAKTDEIVALAKVVAAHDGIYASHMRYETVRIFSALEELVQVARNAGVKTEVSHIKLSGPSAWGKGREVLDFLDKARADGLRITQDQYAYTASSTGLRQVIPDSALEGTRADFAARLQDPAKKAEILSGMREILARSGRTDYTYAVIARFPADPSLNGLTIPQAARKVRGSDSVGEQMELLLDIERRGGGSGVFLGMNEDDLKTFLKHPLTMVASDGGPRLLGEDVPHPRSYGNNARILARYVREQKVLSLEEAVRRMSRLPAETFGLKDRGIIRPEAWADLVIFDPEKVTDESKFEDPHHYATGFDDVLVDGVPVIRNGKLTGARPGGPLRKERISEAPQTRR